MRVIVETARPESISGWAFDESDPTHRARIEVILDGRVAATGIADRPRPDLLGNGVGDGLYGYELALETDDLLEAHGRDIDVLGVDHEGFRTAATFISAEQLSNSVLELSCRGGPKIVGASFLLDNLRAFNPSRTSGRGAPSRDMRGFLAVRVYRLADFMRDFSPQSRGPAAATHPLARLGPRTRHALASGELFLLLDMSNEGEAARANGHLLALVHDEFERQDIRTTSCVLLTQNRAFEFDYRRWCSDNGRIVGLNVLNYDYFIARMAYLLEAEALAPALGPPKGETDWRCFVCLNYTPREVRTPFVGWLFGRGLADRGFVSFYGFTNAKESVFEDAIPPWFPDREAAAAGLVELRKLGRILLDLPAEETFAVPEFDLGPLDCYARAFFSIVTETDFFGSDLERITEKTIKPLALGHPILVVGNPRSLELLRGFGFKTFHPLIDETYDGIDDKHARMTCLQREISRLCALSHAELTQMRVALEDTVRHNWLHARRGLAMLFRTDVEPELLSKLADIYALSARRDDFGAD